MSDSRSRRRRDHRTARQGGSKRRLKDVRMMMATRIELQRHGIEFVLRDDGTLMIPPGAKSAIDGRLAKAICDEVAARFGEKIREPK